MTFSTKALMIGGGLMALLGGCGDGSPFDFDTNRATAETYTDGPSPLAVDLDPLAITLGGTIVQDPAAAEVLTSGSATVNLSQDGNYYTVSIIDDDAFALTTASDGLTVFGAASTYARRSTTLLPTVGAATFTGDYAGLGLSDYNSVDQTLNDIITGDARLEADFFNRTISGEITNRTVYDGTGNERARFSVADISLEQVEIADDGTFTGALTGGEYIDDTELESWVAGDGTLSGVIAGDNGATAAGAVSLTHSEGTDGPVVTERGIFVARDN